MSDKKRKLYFSGAFEQDWENDGDIERERIWIYAYDNDTGEYMGYNSYYVTIKSMEKKWGPYTVRDFFTSQTVLEVMWERCERCRSYTIDEILAKMTDAEKASIHKAIQEKEKEMEKMNNQNTVKDTNENNLKAMLFEHLARMHERLLALGDNNEWNCYHSIVGVLDSVGCREEYNQYLEDRQIDYGETWYEEKWSVQDLTDIMTELDIPVTKKNVDTALELSKGIFDDLSDRFDTLTNFLREYKDTDFEKMR